MRHFGRADAEGVGAERAVGRGVAVAADDQQTRQGQALLRARPHARCPAADRPSPNSLTPCFAVFSSTCRTMRASSGLAMFWREPRVGT